MARQCSFFFICFHMCLRFSFYLILLECLELIFFFLSIWVNLHIYIDIFGLKFLIINLYCIWQMKHLYYLEKNQNCKLCLLAQEIVNFYLVYYIWIFWIWSVLFGFEVEFGDSIKCGSFKSWGFWYLRFSRLILILYLIWFCFIENFYLGSCDFLFS